MNHSCLGQNIPIFRSICFSINCYESNNFLYLCNFSEDYGDSEWTLLDVNNFHRYGL